MAEERPKRVATKPKRFAEEFSRSMTVKKTEARKRDKRLYEVEVIEVDKVKKEDKNSLCWLARNLTSGDFSMAMRDPTISTSFQMPFPEPILSPM